MVRLTFAEVDQIVDRLPASANNHRAWWENEVEGSHVQARAWMAAGYKVREVALGSWVIFEKRLD
jgi:hypothetical protein